MIVIISCTQNSKNKSLAAYSIVTDTFSNGNPKRKLSYLDSSNKNNYLETQFYENGNISKKILIVDTPQQGYYKVYWNKPGKVLYYQVSTYNNSKINLEKSFDSSGRLIRQDSLDGNCRGEPFTCNAVVTLFFPNGLPKEKFRINNGERNGLYVEYFENGIIHTMGTFANGKRNGIFKIYDETGKYRQTINIVNDLREGPAEAVIIDDAQVTGQFKKDKEEGKWVMKDPSGKPVDSFFYKNGKIVKSKKTSAKN
jgi:antitoxin component YwqK of YwqJK toxin-antitoxin module